MASHWTQLNSGSELSTLPAAYCEPRWYAAYTSANHEKRVAEQLVVRSVEHFLPVYASVRRWKDRRVTLQLPLFPGYVFVRMALQDRLEPHPYLRVGRRVRVKGGPMTGMEGILVRRKGKLRVVVSVDQIQRSVAIEVDASELFPV